VGSRPEEVIESLIKRILPADLWPLVRLTVLRKSVSKILSGGKVWAVRKAYSLPSICKPTV
jgi:hypothetical protein